jgi:hypothetical protein
MLKFNCIYFIDPDSEKHTDGREKHYTDVSTEL